MVRYEMYRSVKAYTSKSSGERPSEEQLVQLAQDIKFNDIYKQVFELFKIDIDYHDMQLTMKKLDFVFQE